MVDKARDLLSAGTGSPILEIDDLHTFLYTDRGVIRAVNGVSFDVGPSDKIAVVGESGSGKSITAMSIMGLLPSAAKIVKGSVRFAGRSLTDMRDGDLAKLRGNEMSIIFQDPMSALDPLKTVVQQVSESLLVHDKVDHKDARRTVVELLDEVGLPEPDATADRYPHQLSGGMHQRVMIASALACQPKLLIADEPTTALDATLQAQILDLLARLARDRQMAIILITHDMGAVARFADRVVILYAGKILEQGTIDEIFYEPRHPYSSGLIESIPGRRARQFLPQIPGTIPNPDDLPSGCIFHPRCRLMKGRAICREHAPALVAPPGSDHAAACHFSDEVSPPVTLQPTGGVA